MEQHANSSTTSTTTTSTTTTTRQQQENHQHQQLQQLQQEQQEQHEHEQQFCLRWHNHQTSLLSTLPILLDQSHLTDVTISAEGRTLRAHRVVLSACSTFFLELFRTLDNTNHPVIIIPGASFAAIVALLTFMYSGEVNVYEEQIPMLLNLAETLGIKGLADVQNNQKSARRSTEFVDTLHCDEPVAPLTPPPAPAALLTTSTAPTTQQCTTVPTPVSPLTAPLLAKGLPTPLENFFLKSLQLYPNLLPQPLNFSQTALNKTTELLAKYQQQCNLYHGALGGITGKDLPLPDNETATPNNDELLYNSGTKRLCSGEKKYQHQQQQLQQQLQQQKDIKHIDKIVDSLRSGRKTPQNVNDSITHQQQQQQQQFLTLQQLNKKPTYGLANNSPQLSSPKPQYEQYANCSRDAASASRATPESVINVKTESNLLSLTGKLPSPTTPTSPQTKPPSNSKLYATCFICHKQLSNQYNLRVHLETHQNVRYACNVCTHVSRSKDALRKHVSYRHPGAPSPCETEARRKRNTKTLNATSPPTSTITTPVTRTSPAAGAEIVTTPTTPPAAPFENERQANASAQLNSAYMFLPNQFHLAAAAAAAVQQQQQQQHLQNDTDMPSRAAALDFVDCTNNGGMLASSQITNTGDTTGAIKRENTPTPTHSLSNPQSNCIEGGTKPATCASPSTVA